MHAVVNLANYSWLKSTVHWHVLTTTVMSWASESIVCATSVTLPVVKAEGVLRLSIHYNGEEFCPWHSDDTDHKGFIVNADLSPCMLN